jgi:hypothetical protein
MKEAEMLTTTALRERGWSSALIAKLLGEPDGFKRNPHYRSAAPLRLYDAARVESAESSPEFVAKKTGTAARSASARKAAETKRDTLLRQVEAMEVQVEIVPAEQLQHLAIRSYAERKAARERAEEEDYYYCYVDDSAPAEFLQRIAVNFIRHNLTAYDRTLVQAAGRVGVVGANQIIRRKVDDAIAEAYPELAQECERQMLYRKEQMDMARNYLAGY